LKSSEWVSAYFYWPQLQPSPAHRKNIILHSLTLTNLDWASFDELPNVSKCYPAQSPWSGGIRRHRPHSTILNEREIIWRRNRTRWHTEYINRDNESSEEFSRKFQNVFRVRIKNKIEKYAIPISYAASILIIQLTVWPITRWVSCRSWVRFLPDSAVVGMSAAKPSLVNFKAAHHPLPHASRTYATVNWESNREQMRLIEFKREWIISLPGHSELLSNTRKHKKWT